MAGARRGQHQGSRTQVGPGLVLTGAALTMLAVARGLPRPAEIGIVAVFASLQLVALQRSQRVLSGNTAQPGRSDSVGARAASAMEAEVSTERQRLHEVRTSVAAIGATHRLLRNGAGILPSATRYRLEALYDSEICRLERLLDDRRPTSVTCLDLDALLEPLLEALRLRGRPLRRHGHGGRVLGRSDEIVQILYVLLENAARHAPGRPVEIRVVHSSGQVLLQVADRGDGVPETMATSIFDAGVRAADSPGQGIGLYVARRLAREMGGDLRLEPPRARRGATFTLLLQVPREGP